MSAGDDGRARGARETTRLPIRRRARLPPPARPSFLKRLFLTKLDKSTRRIKLIGFAFLLCYGIIAGRLIHFGMTPQQPTSGSGSGWDTVAAARPDILDRHGEILATDIKVTSVFADPLQMIDKDEAVDQLTSVLPDLDADELLKKLRSRKGFVWIKRADQPEAAERNLSPRPAGCRLRAGE